MNPRELIKLIINDIQRSAKIIQKYEFLPYPPLFDDKQGLRLSWPGKVGLPFNGSYSEVYNEILSGRQFTFGVGKLKFSAFDDPLLEPEVIQEDEFQNLGLFQFFYEFQDGELCKARMAFLPDSNIHPNFIRIDFDGNCPDDSKHTKCHLQLYPLNDLRIPLVSLPPPSAFIEFCVRHFYHELWSQTFEEICNHHVHLEQLFLDGSDIRGLSLVFKRHKNSS